MQYGPQDEGRSRKRRSITLLAEELLRVTTVMNGGRLFSKLFSYVSSKCARRKVSRCSTKIMLGDERSVQGGHFGRSYPKGTSLCDRFPSDR